MFISPSLSHLSLSHTHTHTFFLSFISFLLILAVWNYEGGSAYQLSLSVGDLVVIIERFGGLFTFVSSRYFSFSFTCMCVCHFYIYLTFCLSSFSSPPSLGWYRGYLYHYPSRKVCVCIRILSMHIFSVSLIIMYTNSVYFMILLCIHNYTHVCACASCTCIVDYATGFIITFVSIFRYIIVYIYSVTQFVILSTVYWVVCQGCDICNYF